MRQVARLAQRRDLDGGVRVDQLAALLLARPHKAEGVQPAVAGRFRVPGEGSPDGAGAGDAEREPTT